MIYHVNLLFQALAELYVIDAQYEKAFALYADVSTFHAHMCASTVIHNHGCNLELCYTVIYKQYLRKQDVHFFLDNDFSFIF